MAEPRGAETRAGRRPAGRGARRRSGGGAWRPARRDTGRPAGRHAAPSAGRAAEVWRHLRRERAVLARLAAWSVLEAGQTFLTGYALARALDDGFLAGERGVGLGWLAVAALAVVVGAYGTGRVYRAVAALVEPLRDALVRRVVERALRESARDGAPGTGDAAVSRLTHQVEIARDTFAGLVMVSRAFVFTAAGALIGLCSLAPELLLVVLPPLLLGIGLFVATLRPLARRQEAFLVADETIAESLGGVAAGLRDITAAGAEERIAARSDAHIESEARAARALARWGVLRVVAVAVGGRLPVVLLLVAGPWLLDHGVTAGALVGAFVYLTQSLLPALQSLMHALGTGGSRLAVVLRRLSGPREPADHGRPPRSAAEPPAASAEAPPAVELRAVSFAYGESAAPVVAGLDLTVPAGGHLAVVGPSGIGKSTLAGLIAGVLEPRGGEIRVCGRPVRGDAAPHATGLRVLIPQEAYVFSGTLGDNLRYLRPDPVPEAELAAAAAAVGLDGLAERLGGSEAVLDPAALSAGERQLIALGRAYLSCAPVVLLDEATCHLDPAAEARVERAFARRPVPPGPHGVPDAARPTRTTLVVIAHRAASARRADRILVLDGRRTDCGRHAELLERSALYRDLAGDWSGEELHPAGAARYADRVDAVARPGLAGDGGHVVAHGPVGQVQAVRDLGDGGAPGGQ
ncbi:ABC transporter ATP-binding protein [Streptomyces sp. LX-29]|uniref:ABC transporter ATP-binding protein n=1 Tax=Streptomyces sp. LX-29 TaxID=2900152 RepID=UPI00321ACAE2